MSWEKRDYPVPVTRFWSRVGMSVEVSPDGYIQIGGSITVKDANAHHYVKVGTELIADLYELARDLGEYYYTNHDRPAER